VTDPAASSNNDAAASLVLIAATVAALVAANSSLIELYRDFLAFPVEVRFGDELLISKPLVLWISDGLMAVFFFFVGLEIKSEVLEGALSSRDRAVLPLVAALGGMAMPALIYVTVTWSDPRALHGWAIPAATDIAFAVGILGLVGSRAPAALKAFLLALAVLDDLGAIVIIAAFYTSTLSLASFLGAGVCIAVLFVMNRAGVRRASAFVLIGMVLWVAVLKSGVHATLAGVITALFVPLRNKDGSEGPLHALHIDLNWAVSFLIVPLFAFANAGVPVVGLGLPALGAPVTAGVIFGLVLGKPVGVVGASLLAVRFGVARLPDGVAWRHMIGAGCLAGIGFTMSLFIGTLAFGDPQSMNQVRLGVLAGSALSALAGVAVLVTAARRAQRRA
jgi:NhaA family Na+:H+ antiporter